MIDHLGLAVSDYPRAKAFYQKALMPLGYTLVMEISPPVTEHSAAGFGANRKPSLWISEGETHGHGVHVALVAKDRAAVDSFYRAALAAGGTDNGAPGIRAHYHPHYYGAFVLDPDGNNVEAVCHLPA